MFKNLNLRKQPQQAPSPTQQMEQFYMNQFMNNNPSAQASPPIHEGGSRRSKPNQKPNPIAEMGQHLMNLEHRLSQIERHFGVSSAPVQAHPSSPETGFQTFK